MLQQMQQSVVDEGEKDQAQFDKHMCYCSDTFSALSKSIAEAKDKISLLGSGLKSSGEKRVQTKQELKNHQASRTDARATMAKATKLRQQEEAAFKAEEAGLKTNIGALTKAVKAIASGNNVAFLQTSTAELVRSFVIDKAVLPDDTREALLAFLSEPAKEKKKLRTKDQAENGELVGPDPADREAQEGTRGSTTNSNEILGILKQMLEDMQKYLSDATAQERASMKTFQELSAAKAQEVEALTRQIELLQVRSGELSLEIKSGELDLEDTEKSLVQDAKFLAQLKSDCAAKTKQWDATKKARADELVALGQTIKILNDDDALDLFRKTLPGPATSLVQIQVSQKAVRARALAAVHSARRHSRGVRLPARPGLDLISLALVGKKVSLAKVVSMIDTMVGALKKEQKDDDKKKEWCEAELDKADDQKKSLTRAISDLDAAIEEVKGNIDTLKDELGALAAGVKALDKSVAEATALRKSEHKEYSDEMSNHNAAKELLTMAKGVLRKFYQSALLQAAPGADEDEEDGAPAFVQVSARAGAAPPPPPEASAAYTKKGAASNGVVAMIDLLVKDLDKEMWQAETQEKNIQKAYEDLLADAAAKRAEDAKSITDKESASSEEQEVLEGHLDSKGSSARELQAKLKSIQSLHGECDWNLKHYKARKEARAGELESLVNAKAVLSGADYSLLQAGLSTRVLHRTTARS